MTRHVPRRRGDPHPRYFEPLPFHGWYGCRGCSSVVVDWAVHQEACHGHEDQAEDAAIGPADLPERANAEGRAVVEFSVWREAWRQAAACLRLRPPRDTRPAAPDDPPPAAGRAQQWAAMTPLIQRTTGRA